MPHFGIHPLVLSRMASVDRIAFKTIASSVDIQEGLRARGFRVLKDETSIKSNIMAFAKEVKQEIKAKLEKLRLTQKFAITLDEWTAINNRR